MSPIEVPSTIREPARMECKVCHKETSKWGIFNGHPLCYECCANLEVEIMLVTGRHNLLYLLMHTKKFPGTHGWQHIVNHNTDRLEAVPCVAVGNNLDKVAFVTNFADSLRFGVTRLKESSAGFIRHANYFWFNGPGGVMWRGVNRGDIDLSRTQATKHRYRDITPEEQKIKELRPLHTFLGLEPPAFKPRNK